MKYKTIKFCSLLILLSFCNITKAQQFLKLKGKVLDEKKRPISFCHITLKDKPSKGVISTYGGYFVIEMMSTDTLEISSVGYEKTILHSKFDVDSITIILKKDVLDLPEFTIKYNKKLTPQKIIKQTLKKWNINNLVYDNSEIYKTSIRANFRIQKNNNSIYNYNGNTNLVLQNNRILSYLKDTINRKQTNYIPEKILNLQGGSPYFLLPQIYYILQTDNKYKYEFGEIHTYKNMPVYHIKYHRKNSNDVCEGGGYYLISKDNYQVLYIELVSKNCIGFEDKDESMIWEHSLLQYYFNNNLNQKYHIEKIKNELKYNHNKDNVSSTYFYRNKLVVTKISPLKNNGFNVDELVGAGKVFYKHYE